MTNEEFDDLLQKHLAPIHDQLAQVRGDIGVMRGEIGAIQGQMAQMRGDIDAMQPHVAGIPLINRAIESLRHDVRQIKVAVNDLAAVQMTSGEAEALHNDLDRTMTRQDGLEARLATVERQIKELRDAHP